MSRRKHCEVIKAWADGAVVQCKDSNGEWMTIDAPTFSERSEYRASLAAVEGKPVFVGDVLYFAGTVCVSEVVAHRSTQSCIVEQHGAAWSINYLHWTPPKPETITVTIPRPTDFTFATGFVKLYYDDDKSDATDVFQTIREAMK